MKKHKQLIKPILGKGIISIFICSILLTTTIAATTSTNPITNETEDSNELTYTFSFYQPTLKTISAENSDYTKIQMKGCLSIGKTGQPTLPIQTIKLLIPAGKTIKQVMTQGKPQQLDTKSIDLLQQPVFPYQPSIPIGTKIKPDFSIDYQLYATDAMYPSNLYNDYQIGYSHGYTIFSTTLQPVQYNPNKGKIQYHSEITLTIQLEDTQETNQFYRNDLGDEAWVKNLVSNPELTKTYQTNNPPTFEYPGGLCDPGDNYDYVIITTTHNGLDYWATGGTLVYNWDDLMQKHNDQDNLKSTLVTVQDIDACTDYHNSDPLFNDIEAHIREFCKDAYEDWGTDYILIGGDDEWIPARHMDASVEYDVDSDLYWSNLDNDFNADHDSYWGESGDSGFDLYSEIFIGRITCDEPQDVSNWLTKSFYYADSADQDYLENSAFYGGNTGWNCQGDDFMDFSAIYGTDDWLGPIPHADGPWPTWLGFLFGFLTWNSLNPGNEYNMTQMWTAEPPNPLWQGGSESVAIAGLKQAINDDNVAVISGIAHANSAMSLDVYSTEWESDYHNTKPFFIHDYGCHCGDMDASDDGVLHSMLFHSDTELAFGCVYNTGYGWGNFDTTNSSSALQTKLFWDYFFDLENNSEKTSNWQFGKGHAWSKDAMAPTIDWDGTWRSIIQCCLLFGDPAQLFKPPIADSSPPETTLDYDGTQGLNGWYIATGNAILTATDQSSVNITYYRINEGAWQTYTGPFPIAEEGVNIVHFYSIDSHGYIEDVKSAFVKLDFTEPDIWLTKEKISDSEILITAHLLDDHSGPQMVNFFLDGAFQITDEEAPYEWTLTTSGKHEITGVGFDLAGHSAEDVINTRFSVSYFILEFLTQFRIFNFLKELLTNLMNLV